MAKMKPMGRLRPKSSRHIPRKYEGPSCTLASPKVLIRNGQWAVPECERPTGWQTMALTSAERINRPAAPKVTFRELKREWREKRERHGLKVEIQERHGGYPFPTPVTKYGTLDKNRLAELMRQNPKPSEARLWHRVCKLGLRGKEAPKFQVLMLGYIVDIYFPKAKLVVEVDGSIHDTPEAQVRDAYRDSVFRKNKFKVVRFSNDQVADDLEGVIAKIQARIHPPEQLPGCRCKSTAGGSLGMSPSTTQGVRADEPTRSQKSRGNSSRQGEPGRGNVISGVEPIR